MTAPSQTNLETFMSGLVWWDYRGGSFHRGHGLRIDFVLGTQTLRRSLQTALIDRDYRKKQDGLTASDHAPVLVDLEAP